MTEQSSPVSTVSEEETSTATLTSSEATPVLPKPPSQTDTPHNLEDLHPGMKLEGKVKSVVKFGAFVDVGVGQDGLLHISELKKEGLEGEIKAGQNLEVWIQGVDLETNRLSLSLRKRTMLEDLQVGSVVEGHIVRMEKYGAFVDIGAVTDGLVHISKFPQDYTGRAANALKVGDRVKVKIEAVDVERGRISLSMRNSEPRPARRKPPKQRRRKRIPAGNLAYEDRMPSVPTAMQIAMEEAERRAREKAANRE